MYVVIVDFLTLPNCFQAFVERVKQQASDSLKLETGCHQFDICIDPSEDNHLLLYEIYSNKQAFDDHLESSHFRDFSREVENWVSDKKVSLFERI